MNYCRSAEFNYAFIENFYCHLCQIIADKYMWHVPQPKARLICNLVPGEKYFNFTFK